MESNETAQTEFVTFFKTLCDENRLKRVGVLAQPARSRARRPAQRGTRIADGHNSRSIQRRQPVCVYAQADCTDGLGGNNFGSFWLYCYSYRSLGCE